MGQVDRVFFVGPRDHAHPCARDLVQLRFHSGPLVKCRDRPGDLGMGTSGGQGSKGRREDCLWRGKMLE